jgi:hypothetical protein
VVWFFAPEGPAAPRSLLEWLVSLLLLPAAVVYLALVFRFAKPQRAATNMGAAVAYGVCFWLCLWAFFVIDHACFGLWDSALLRDYAVYYLFSGQPMGLVHCGASVVMTALPWWDRSRAWSIVRFSALCGSGSGVFQFIGLSGFAAMAGHYGATPPPWALRALFVGNWLILTTLAVGAARYRLKRVRRDGGS